MRCHRIGRLAVLATFGIAAVLIGCRVSDDPGCVHPCDLAGCVSIAFPAVSAAEVSVSPNCHLSEACPKDKGCDSVQVCLNATNGPWDTVSCQVTATSVRGDVAATELVAQLISSPCCGGYEFPTTFVRMTFDESADAGAPDGDAMGFEDAQ